MHNQCPRTIPVQRIIQIHLKSSAPNLTQAIIQLGSTPCASQVLSYTLSVCLRHNHPAFHHTRTQSPHILYAVPCRVHLLGECSTLLMQVMDRHRLHTARQKIAQNSLGRRRTYHYARRKKGGHEQLMNRSRMTTRMMRMRMIMIPFWTSPLLQIRHLVRSTRISPFHCPAQTSTRHC